MFIENKIALAIIGAASNKTILMVIHPLFSSGTYVSCSTYKLVFSYANNSLNNSYIAIMHDEANKLHSIEAINVISKIVST